jgi:hypothetical protein
MAISITKPTVGGNEDTWGGTINTALDTIVNGVNGTSGTIAPNLSTLTINGTDVTATAAELNFVDGVTSNIQTQLNSAGTMSSFQLEDGDGTEVTISDGVEVKFVEGAGIDINWTDTNGGTDADPFDMTFSIKADHRVSASVAEVYVGSQTDYIHMSVNTGTRFYRGSSEEMRLADNGNLDVEGNITAYSTTVSDQRLKHDIEKIDNALDKVSQINGYTFTYNKDNKKSAGVVAQEIEQVLPSAVNSQKLVFHGQEDIEYKTVQYDQLHGLLIEAIKELKAEIEELKNGSTN